MNVVTVAALDHNSFAIEEPGDAPATALGPVNTCFVARPRYGAKNMRARHEEPEIADLWPSFAMPRACFFAQSAGTGRGRKASVNRP
jgi:hypothetical protein